MTNERKETDNMDWEKRFEKIGTYTNEYGYVHKIPNHDLILAFIRTEIQEAEKRGRNEVLESVERELPEHKIPNYQLGGNYEQDNAYNQALSEVKSIIQTHKV